MEVNAFWFGFLMGGLAVIGIEIAALVVVYFRKKKK